MFADCLRRACGLRPSRVVHMPSFPRGLTSVCAVRSWRGASRRTRPRTTRRTRACGRPARARTTRRWRRSRATGTLWSGCCPSGWCPSPPSTTDPHPPAGGRPCVSTLGLRRPYATEDGARWSSHFPLCFIWIEGTRNGLYRPNLMGNRRVAELRSGIKFQPYFLRKFMYKVQRVPPKSLRCFFAAKINLQYASLK